MARKFNYLVQGLLSVRTLDGTDNDRIDETVMAATEAEAVQIIERTYDRDNDVLDYQWLIGPRVVNAQLPAIERQALAEWNAGKPFACEPWRTPLTLALARGEIADE